jgi:streptomycin 6-kinase
VTLKDGPGAVLKLGMPHMEGADEIAGLRFWNGDPTVQLLEAHDARGAMLLERCEPGTALGTLPEPRQDVIIAGCFANCGGIRCRLSTLSVLYPA